MMHKNNSIFVHFGKISCVNFLQNSVILTLFMKLINEACRRLRSS